MMLGVGGEGEEWVLQSPIHVAAYQGDLAALEELLKTGKFWIKYSFVC